MTLHAILLKDSLITQYQEAQSIHDQSAHQKEDLFGDIEQAKRDEDIAKVDGHIEHKIPETPAQGIAQEALEKIGMGTGGRMMDLARSSEIPDGIALIQEEGFGRQGEPSTRCYGIWKR